MHYSKDDIIRMVEEEDVDFIRLQFTDTFGNLKNMAVTSNQLELVLDNRYTFDGAAINGFDTENVDELILVPDLDTFAIFPWPAKGKSGTLYMRCDESGRLPFYGRLPLYIKSGCQRSKKDGLYLQCQSGIRIFPL